MIGTERKHKCSTREITVVSHWNLSSEDFEFPNMLFVKGSRFVATFAFNAHFDRFTWAARGYDNQFEIEIGRTWSNSIVRKVFNSRLDSSLNGKEILTSWPVEYHSSIDVFFLFNLGENTSTNLTNIAGKYNFRWANRIFCCFFSCYRKFYEPSRWPIESS